MTRPWNPRGSDHQWNSASALIDPRPEPGLRPTLAAAIEAHPRTARAIAIAFGLALAAVLALLGVRG